MAPTTRQNNRDVTPDRPIGSGEYDTIKRTRIFQLWDACTPTKSKRAFCKQENIPRTTLHDLLALREKIGKRAYRRQRPLSEITGRPRIVTREQVRTALQAPKKQRLKTMQHQVNDLGITASKRSFQRALAKYSNHGRIYKARWRGKKLSAKNKRERIEYGRLHEHHTIKDYYAYVVYTDEAHFEENERRAPGILREQGTAEEPQNMVERGERKPVVLHIAGWVNWYAKCDKLEFYNDEGIISYTPDMRKKPRRSKYEDDATYQQRVKVWDAEKPHRRVSTPKGNAMTELYYTERLLPVYCKAVNQLRSQYSKSGAPWQLMEDNDSSHGHGSEGIATQYKQSHNVTTMWHPGNSPDLNPIEACWGILKQRVRKRSWDNIEQLKEVMQDEWGKISMDEVRKRIGAMQWRAQELIKRDGTMIRADGW